MSVTLRPARADDAGLLFDWVNRPDSLAGKLRTSGPIAWSEHCAWFARRLADPDCRIAIVEAGGGPAGQLRLERGPEGWEVDIFVLPEKRRGGVALAALAAGLAALRRDVGSAPAVARVRHANAASRALFERAGFRRAGGDDRAAIYRHDG